MCLMAAEHAGGARWCLDTATEYAKVRVQFGRPIGQFQAVKHRLADMAIRVEQMTAVAWDAALAVDSDEEHGAICAGLRHRRCPGPRRLRRGATECLQILGGIGFTWEHDLHLHLKRAMADRQLMGSPRLLRRSGRRGRGRGPTHLGCRSARRGRHGARRFAPVVAELAAADEASPASPWSTPGWSRRTGRVRGVGTPAPSSRWSSTRSWPQAGIAAPAHRRSAAWALPTIIARGTPEQQDAGSTRPCWARSAWCQLFSEPGAGSDLATLSHPGRADRRAAGCSTARRSGPPWPSRPTGGSAWPGPTRDAPKHAGHHLLHRRHDAPRARRPAVARADRAAMFNEVFFDDVFVPDDCVVGEVDGGWRLARTTLANERVSMSSGSTFGIGVESSYGWPSGGGRRRHRGHLPIGHCWPRPNRCADGPPGRRWPPWPAPTRDRRRACASCWVPSTSSGCRNWAWPCSAPKGPTMEGGRSGGPRDSWPPGA